MRSIINIIMIVVIALLVWVLYSSIREPIEFKAEMEKRETAVIDRLMQVRKAQEIYRDIEGKFANRFDSLKYVLRNGKIMNISVFGDPDDPSNTDAIRYDTSYQDAMVSVKDAGLNLDSLEYVPFSGGKTFNIQADTVTYQSTLVDVVEVGTVYKNFMGKYGDPKYARYDNSYDPNATMKFGNMTAPNLAGNWER